MADVVGKTRCKECEFWDLNGEEGRNGSRRCRESSPVPLVLAGAIHTVHPWTGPEVWCGRGRKREAVGSDLRGGDEPRYAGNKVCPECGKRASFGSFNGFPTCEICRKKE